MSYYRAQQFALARGHLKSSTFLFWGAILGANIGYFVCRKNQNKALEDYFILTGKVETVSEEISGNRPRWNYREIKYSYAGNESIFTGKCQISSRIKLIVGYPIVVRVAKEKIALSTCDPQKTEMLIATNELTSWVKRKSFKPQSREANARFFNSIYQDNQNALQVLLNAGVSSNTTYGTEGPAIVYAAGLGRAEIVSLLITKGANVNARAPGGESAINVACSSGKADILNLLWNAGAKDKCNL